MYLFCLCLREAKAAIPKRLNCILHLFDLAWCDILCCSFKDSVFVTLLGINDSIATTDIRKIFSPIQEGGKFFPWNFYKHSN